ncbi:RNA-dependent RNA polymerase, partial [Tremellales sp. Uapishka_1]
MKVCDSWQLSSHPLDVQRAYQHLRSPPLSLADLHSGPYPDTLTGDIYRSVHELLTRAPARFVQFVERECRYLGGGGVRTPPKGLRRGINPRMLFRARLRDELKEIGADEVAKGEAVVEMEGYGESQIPVVELYGLSVKDEFRGGGGERNTDSPSRTLSSEIEAISFATPSHSHSKQVSPSKRNNEDLPPGNLLKRFRAVQPTPPAPTSRASSFSTAYPASHTSSETLTPISTAPASPLKPRTTEKSWRPLEARASDEKLIHVLPPNAYQALMNKQDVRFQVQWDLERTIALNDDIDWDDLLMEDFRSLAGPVTQAGPRVEGLVQRVIERKTGARPTDTLEIYGDVVEGKQARLFREVDLEEASLRAKDLRGLGTADPDWPFGGKISYCVLVERRKPGGEGVKFHRPLRHSASVPAPLSGPIQQPTRSRSDPAASEYNPFNPPKSDDTALPFKMSLRPASMPGKSFRLARRFGSRRILTFKIAGSVASRDRPLVYEMFLGRCFVLFGKTFRAIWAPPDSDNIITVETNDVGLDMPRNLNDPLMPSFLEMMAGYNDLTQKSGQAMAKWAARPQILFSDSVPATTVDAASIAIIPDIVTRLAQLRGSAATEETLTDGCGLMSESVARRISQNPQLRFECGRPCVVQMRIGGAKGLLALMSPTQERQYKGAEVVLRDSMIKSLPSPRFVSDPSLFIVDVLRVESLKIGINVNSEAIIVMVHNGVNRSAFADLRDRALEELRLACYPHCLEGENEEMMIDRLVRSCYRIGGVGSERKKKQVVSAGLSTKVAGLSRTSSEEYLLDGLRPIDPAERYHVDPISGQPGSLAECVMESVMAGFLPSESAYTGQKLHRLMKVQSESLVRKFKIPIEASLSAFIVPDSMEILAPDEIFICFSGTGPVDPETKCPMSYLEGPCLALRSPCKLPTDVRKFTAVYRPELSHLRDCVVMSASSALCKRSPASFLGGGDYDGDTVQLIWDPMIVNDFQNADDSFAEALPTFETDNFDKEVVKGDVFLESMEGQGEEAWIINYQKFLLGALLDDRSTGTYSDLHGNAVYKYGLDHPDSVRLARMFCLVLDARKSGLAIKPEVRKTDLKDFGGDLEWRQYKKEEENPTHNPIMMWRPHQLGVFVMDELMEEGKRKQQIILRDFPSEINSLSDFTILSKLWSTAIAKAKSGHDAQLREQLDIVKRHVLVIVAIGDEIRQRRISALSIRELYERRLAGESVGQSPRKAQAADSRASPDVEIMSIGSRPRSLVSVWLHRDAAGIEDQLCGLSLDQQDETAFPMEQALEADSCGSDFSIQVSKHVGGLPGHVYFEHVWYHKETFYLYADDEQSIPPRDEVLTHKGGYVVRNPSEARPPKAQCLTGTTLLIADRETFFHRKTFLDSFYHFNELILGAWAVLASIPGKEGNLMVPEIPQRLVLPWIKHWKDDYGLTPLFVKSVFRNDILPAREWKERIQTHETGGWVYFERVVIIDRWTSHRHNPLAQAWNLMSLDAYHLPHVPDFYDKARQALFSSLSISPRHGKELLPKIVYIDRQGGHRRLTDESHLGLIRVLSDFEREKRARIAHVRLEDFDQAKQVEIVADANILIGVHGMGLTHMLWMNLGGSVIEIFPPDTFIRAYAALAKVLSLSHTAVWNDTVLPREVWEKTPGEMNAKALHNGIAIPVSVPPKSSDNH